jgi:hypothetical protein
MTNQANIGRLRKHPVRGGLTGLCMAASALGVALPMRAMAESPFDGSWKIELSSANFSRKPDIYVLKDGTYSCKTCVPPYTIKADGSDQPVSGHPGFDTVALKAVDARTVQETHKKDGKTVYTETDTVAPDGKTVDVDFTDINQNGTSVTGKVTIEQVAAGPTGSHGISGSWITTSVGSVSDIGLTDTYRTDGDTLTMTNATGESYTAKMDGTPAPFTGNPNITGVSVKKAGDRTLIVTYSRDGKSTSVLHMTVSADGNAMHVSSHSMLTGHTTTWTSEKI